MVLLYNFNKSSYENVSWSKLTYPVLHSFPLFLLCRPCNQFSTPAESSIFCTASVLPEELTNQIPWLYCWPKSPEDGGSWFTVPLLSCPVFWVTRGCVSACSIIYHKIGLFLSESQWDQWRQFRWEKESMFINIDSKEERGVETFYCIKKGHLQRCLDWRMLTFRATLIEGIWKRVHSFGVSNKIPRKFNVYVCGLDIISLASCTLSFENGFM